MDEASTLVADLCACNGFDLWYCENMHFVCKCGHRDEEHINASGACTGVVEAG